MPGGTSHLYS